ncbi:MAG: A/G-specific adenine glycosylase, partial [Planctomycetota bacterium]
IWISEIMLQQTQVATVLPRYAAWFEHFPDLQALAAAETDAVMKAWEGLGYYRRARLMHQAARQIVEKHAGRFPQRFEEIVRLPGIGRSTAGAIASICFGEAAPVLDGNVRRVLTRWHGRAMKESELWQAARAAIAQASEPGEWNQAMMELGATVCLPRKPRCDVCPVAGDCASAHQAMPDTAKAKPIVRGLHWRVHLHACPERGIWLVQRPASGIWAGLWTPPISETDALSRAPDHIHRLSHRRLHLYLVEESAEPQGDGRWTRLDLLPALPTGIRRLLERCGALA